MAPARVSLVEGDSCEVLSAGRTLTASSLFVPDVSVGDWVLVNGGTVVRRLDPEQAAVMRRAVDQATGERATPVPAQTSSIGVSSAVED